MLFPLRYNDNTEVPLAELNAFREECFERFGGSSVGGVVDGEYRMRDGSKCVEKSTIVFIAVPEHQMGDAESMVRRWCKRLGQEAMYFERTGSKVQFLEPVDDGQLF